MTKMNHKRYILMASASVSTMMMMGSTSALAQTVTVSTSRTAADVNADIAADTNASFTLEITKAGEITTTVAPDDVVIAPAGTARTDAITVTNAGDIGDATDTVGLDLDGVGSEDAANTLTLTNSGLISGGIAANGFGGDVIITNTSSILNGIDADGFGDVTIDSSTGTVGSGNVSAVANDTSNTTTKAGTTTTTVTSGDVTISVGDVVDTAGPTLGNVTANSRAGSATVTVAGEVGDVEARVGTGAATTVSTSAAAVAGATTTTSALSNTASAGDINVTLTADSSAQNLTSVNGGSGDTTVVIDGEIDNASGDIVVTAAAQNEERSNTVTQDKAGNQTATTFDRDRTDVTGDISVSIGGDVDVDDIRIAGSGDNTLAVTGTVVTDNNIEFSSNRFVETSRDRENTTDVKTGATTSETTVVNETTGGSLVLTVGEDGSIDGDDLLMSADDAVTVTNDGVIDIDVDIDIDGATSTNVLSSTFVSSTDAKTGVTTTTSTNASESTTVQTGGDVTIDNNDELNGTLDADTDGGITLVNDGTVDGAVNLDATGSDSTSENNNSTTNVSGATTNSTDSTTTNADTSTSVGGDITITNNVAGEFTANGDLNATANGAIAYINAGSVDGDINLTTDGETSSREAAFTRDFDEDTKAGASTDVQTIETEERSDDTGGDITLENRAGGITETGQIDLDANGDITITNDGSMFSRIDANTSARVSESTFSGDGTITVATDSKTGVVTTTEEAASVETSQITADGGDIVGNYNSVNGSTNFVGGSGDGSISQFAEGDSTITVGGSVFGNVSSTAGNGQDTTSTTTSSSTRVSDTKGNGSFESSVEEITTSSDAGDENSVITITGLVGRSQAGTAGNVSSDAVDQSTVVVNNGVVEGGIDSNAESFSNKTVTTTEFTQATDTGVTETTSYSFDQTTTNDYAGGTSTVTIGSRVGGSIFSGAQEDATITVGATSTVGGSVIAESYNSEDTTSTDVRSFDRDDKTGAVTASRTSSFAQSASDVDGDAVVTVAGEVGNDATARSGAGDATVTVTGQVADLVNADASGFLSSSSTTETFAGDVKVGAGSTSTNFFTLVGQTGVSRTEQSSQTSDTAYGGTANVVINSDAALRDAGEAGAGRATAEGFTAANVSVQNASIVNGAVTSTSTYENNATTTLTTFDADTGATVNRTQTETDTTVGGAATVTNDGVIDGNVFVDGATTSDFVNNGLVGTPGGGVSSRAVTVGSIATNEATTTTEVNLNDTATRTSTTVREFTGDQSTATFANEGVIEGDVSIQASAGTATNNGYLFGSTSMGQSVQQYTRTDSSEAGVQTTTFAAPDAADRFQQSYTANQNGISGGFNVGDVSPAGTGGVFSRVVNPGTGDEELLRTSDIDATINLNSGSVTLGNINAQRDNDTDAALTNTTVNLNGGGYWGLDVIGSSTASPNNSVPTPLFTPSADDLDAFDNSSRGGVFFPGTSLFSSPRAVRGLGLTDLNKTGDGTFVITGAAYQEAAAPALPDTWTLDAENINITGGELQLTLGRPNLGTNLSTDPQFGIRGDINNSANLVIGRRVVTQRSVVGSGIVTTYEAIDGINVLQEGDYNQSASGTTLVGVGASLVRQSPATVSGSGGGGSLLAPITATTGLSLFTDPQFSSVPVSSQSRVDIDGDLDLAGTIAVDVAQDSLFLNGDGGVIFTYTGDGTVTADADGSLASNFVDFDVVHDTTAKTVSVQARRIAFDTAATNPNAVAAAQGLDSALADAIVGIRDDAIGTASFATVSDLELAQDIANIAAGLDYRLTTAQAQEVFNELSGGEVHASLSAIDQAMVVRMGHDTAKIAMLSGEDAKSRVYVSPFARTGDIGGGRNFGASDLDVDTYGASFGADFAYNDNGMFGFAFGYGEHDIEAIGSMEQAELESFSVAAYGTHRYNDFYGSLDLAYTTSNVDTSRTLDLLSRTITAEYDAQQLDGALEVGYVFDNYDNVFLSPYARLEARSWETDGFTEEGGQSVSLIVDDASETVFSPVIGGRASTSYATGNLIVRPYADLSYTFQGDNGSERSVRYLAGGNQFLLRGANPDGFGAIDAGFNMAVSERFMISASVGQTFGGDMDVTSVRGGIGFNF